MKLPTDITSSQLIIKQLTFIYKVILPIILIFTLVWFVLGFNIKKNNTNIENWVNYVNIPLGEIRTGKDCPLVFYKRQQYRLPYRWPLGFKTSYPEVHVTPLTL